MPYTVLYCDDAGGLLEVFDDSLIIELNYTLVENEVNGLELTIPQWFAYSLFDDDRIMVVQRNSYGVEEVDGDRAWLLEDWDFYTDQDGKKLIKLYAVDGNGLLERRVIAYATASANAEKADFADDMGKDLVRENLGPNATDNLRILSGLTIEADKGLAPGISMSFSRKIVMIALQEIANASLEAGTYLVFDTVYTGNGTFEFRSFTGQRGVDHSSQSGDPRVVFLKNEHVITRRGGTFNFIYCGGQGREGQRIIKTATNPAWSGKSRWARREKFVDARNAQIEASVQAQADAALYETRPRIIITGDIVESEYFRFGLDYGWGDVVVVSTDLFDVDCHIVAVHVIYRDGVEQIQSSVRGEI